MAVNFTNGLNVGQVRQNVSFTANPINAAKEGTKIASELISKEASQGAGTIGKAMLGLAAGAKAINDTLSDDEIQAEKRERQNYLAINLRYPLGSLVSETEKKGTLERNRALHYLEKLPGIVAYENNDDKHSIIISYPMWKMSTDNSSFENLRTFMEVPAVSALLQFVDEVSSVDLSKANPYDLKNLKRIHEMKADYFPKNSELPSLEKATDSDLRKIGNLPKDCIFNNCKLPEGYTNKE